MNATIEIRAYQPKFRAIAARTLKGSGIAHIDADDIAQELAIAEWQAGYEALEWKADRLSRQAIRKERAAQRGGGRSSCELDRSNEPSMQSDILGDMIGKEFADMLTELLAMLPSDQQEIVRLRFFEAKTFSEIAAITERSARSVANVAAKLKRAMDHMRDLIEHRSAECALMSGE